MTERFEQEFYPDSWRRVLPLGPDGLQTYVRPAHGRGAADLRRLARSMGRAFGRIAAFGRRAASGMSKRPILASRAPPRMPPGVAPEAARPARAAPQRLRKAA